MPTTNHPAAPPQNNNSDGFFQEWRQSVNEQLSELVKAVNTVTNSATKLATQVDQIEQRLRTVENRPDAARNSFSAYGGCLGQIVYAGLTSFALLISIASVVLSIVLR